MSGKRTVYTVQIWEWLCKENKSESLSSESYVFFCFLFSIIYFQSQLGRNDSERKKMGLGVRMSMLLSVIIFSLFKTTVPGAFNPATEIIFII